jgi:hypothetical protein
MTRCKTKVNLSMRSISSGHEEEWWTGGMAPYIVDLGPKWRCDHLHAPTTLHQRKTASVQIV